VVVGLSPFTCMATGDGTTVGSSIGTR
jgi:hypothetical protein